MELKETIENLGSAFENFKAENDTRLKEIEKKDHADPLLEEKVNKINTDLGEMTAMKKELETVQASVEKMKQLPGGASVIDPAKAEHSKAFGNMFRTGDIDGLKNLEIKAALSTDVDPGAGWLVPEDVEKAIDRVLGTVSTMRQICSVRTTGTDSYKKYVSQGGATSGWVGEGGTISETSTPTLKEILINVMKLYAEPKTTQEMLDDGVPDIAAWLADEVMIEFSEEEGEKFFSGNGVKQPMGINSYTKVANASYAWGKVGFIGNGSTTLTSTDPLINLQHALKSIYRNGAQWLMNDASFAAVRKLKDGDGNYIWVPGIKDGATDTLLGKPVVIDDNVSDIASAAFPIWFANWKRAYLIVDRAGIRVLRDDLTAKGFVKFFTTKRVGGGIQMYEAIKCLKMT